ncbi:MAG: hypothetical protein WDM87_13790 [Terracidiphilus sp.]
MQSTRFAKETGAPQLAFMGLIGATAGRPFAFERLDRTRFIPAMIDSYLGQFEALKDELRKLLI